MAMARAPKSQRRRFGNGELLMPTLPDNLQDDVVPGRALPEAGAAPPTQTGPISLDKKRPRRS